MRRARVRWRRSQHQDDALLNAANRPSKSELNNLLSMRLAASRLGKMIELAGERAEARRVGPQLQDEIAELGCRHQRLDIIPAGPALMLGIPEDLSAPAAEQTLRSRGEPVRHAHRHALDRLQQHGLRPGEGLGDAAASRSAERHVGTVDGMEAAIDKRDFDIDNGIAERAFLHRLLGRLADGGNILARHRATDDLVDKGEARAPRPRRDFQRHIGELTVAAGLALEARVLFHRLFDRLLIGDLRRRDVDLAIIGRGEAFQRAI